MKWRNRRVSNNIEDRRGRVSRGSGKKRGGLSVIIITLAALYFGVDPKIVLSLLDNTDSQTSSTQSAQYQPSAQQQQLAQFVGVVLADTEDTWNKVW